MRSSASKGDDFRCCEFSGVKVVDYTDVVCQYLGANLSVDIDVIVNVSVR